MVHGLPGPAPQTAKREQFARLIARGVSNAEACRVVGVNPRTGKRRHTLAPRAGTATLLALLLRLRRLLTVHLFGVLLVDFMRFLPLQVGVLALRLVLGTCALVGFGALLLEVLYVVLASRFLALVVALVDVLVVRDLPVVLLVDAFIVVGVMACTRLF
ncbi:MAG TPA: hypothetical protein VIJ18_06215 [Microbacteriaceae bacterium]